MFFLNGKLLAQTDSVKKSQQLYQQIERKTSGNRYLKQFYRLLFRPAGRAVKQSNTEAVDFQNPALQDLPVGNIHVIVYDPFGYSLSDTLRRPSGFLASAGNFIHKKTTRKQILGMLRVLPGEPYDSLHIQESERLIRKQIYVRDVKFLPHKNDSTGAVDLDVYVLDAWSLIVTGSTSETSSRIGISERNFAGMGHAFENSYKWYYNRKADVYETSYMVPDILSTYIMAKVAYTYDAYNGENKSIIVERPFYSYDTRLAGGAAYNQNYVKAHYLFNDTTQLTAYRQNTTDVWVGYAMKLMKGNAAYERGSRLVTTVRMYSEQYPLLPASLYDTLGIYTNQNFYLAGIGYSSRIYNTDQYLFKYGQTEDVPSGRMLGCTIGYREKNGSGTWYAGVIGGIGDYTPLGYFSAIGQYGTYFYEANARESTVKLNGSYFTPLLRAGKWKLRQFFRMESVIGIDRVSKEVITFKDELNGFDSYPYGTGRITMSFQTQSYAPVDFYGFRFGPYLVASFGMLGENGKAFSRSRIYSLFGLGLLIRNDFLALSNFQLSFAFYPDLPGKGMDVFKYNPLRSSNFSLQDFDLEKPSTVELIQNN
ncbi:MAG: hypothetical protein JSS90_10620 [Bacteroidetes bacterium]|jgi:hypothetical protein|nr:hypothetical protein [Bacteroidota bacterium]